MSAVLEIIPVHQNFSNVIRGDVLVKNLYVMEIVIVQIIQMKMKNDITVWPDHAKKTSIDANQVLEEEPRRNALEKAWFVTVFHIVLTQKVF